MNTPSNQPAPAIKQKAAYQAPRVETTISSKELERELFYAGGISTPI